MEEDKDYWSRDGVFMEKDWVWESER